MTTTKKIIKEDRLAIEVSDGMVIIACKDFLGDTSRIIISKAELQDIVDSVEELA